MEIGPDCPEISPDLYASGVGGLDRNVTNSSYGTECNAPDLKLGGEPWDVIAQLVVGRQQNHQTVLHVTSKMQIAFVLLIKWENEIVSGYSNTTVKIGLTEN